MRTSNYFDLRRRRRVILAIVNQKGGVGKTTTAVNLSAGLAASGRRVLLVDMDAQGNATTGLGVDRSGLDRCIYSVLSHEATMEEATVETAIPGLRLVPARIELAAAEVELASAIARETRLRSALNPLMSAYDYILIDSGPSLGLLTINSLTAATEVLIPIQCEYYALEGLSQLLRVVDLVREALNPHLKICGVLLTMFDRRLKLAADVASEVNSHFGPVAFETVVPRSVRLGEAPSYGQPVLQYAPDSQGAIAYAQLAQEVIRRAEPGPG
jgi:chromosome partitioning protein